MNEDEEVARLQSLYPTARALKDGGATCVVLPDLPIRSLGQTFLRTALLYPHAHGGYLTRLFLSDPIPGKRSDWSSHTLLTRQWWTWSWQNVRPDQAWTAILANHLAALK